MKIARNIVAVSFLSCLLVHAEAEAGTFVRIPVAKDSMVATDLGFSFELSENTNPSKLQGTITFQLRALKTRKLADLSRVILLVKEKDGQQLTGRFPLELQKGKDDETHCHFQLTKTAAQTSILELICSDPHAKTGGGVVYQIDLSTYAAEQP